MTGGSGTLPVTGLVITFNEDRRLSDCLTALEPCDDVIVVDLGSADRSAEVALRAGARLVTHAWAPNVESLLPDVVCLACNDWIVRLDPDEVRDIQGAYLPAMSTHITRYGRTLGKYAAFNTTVRMFTSRYSAFSSASRRLCRSS